MFALFYNMQDLQTIAAILQRANIRYSSNNDRSLLQACWGGGLNAWQTSPLAPQPYAGNDPDCRIVTVDATFQGHPVTLIQMLDAFDRTALANPREDDAYAGGVEFLRAISSDARVSGGKDPYP